MKNIRFTFRMLRRNPLLLYINIPGLAIGLCAFLLLAVYLKYEFSFDRHFANNNRVLRLVNTIHEDSQTEVLPIGLRTDYTQLPSRVPEVEKAVQLYNGSRPKLTTDRGTFKDLSSMYADAEFFDVFGVKLLEGNTSDALAGKKNLVISQSTAQKLFGTVNCVGKPLLFNDSTLIVSGVMADLPKTTHLKFDMLQPMISNDWILKQGSLEFLTYYLIKEGADMKKAGQNIAAVNEDLLKVWKERGKLNQLKTETGTELLRDIHLYTKTDDDMVPKTNPMHLFIIIGIAVFILLIALINFINMYLLNGEKRIAEIASRKAVGATRGILARQFYLETGIIAFFALALGLFLAVLVQPYFAKMMNMPLTVSDMFTPLGIAMIVAILVVLVLLSGAYPSLHLSKINLVSGLKGKRQNISHGGLSKSVVLVQFFITVLLISSLIIIRAQIKHLKNVPLGFNANNVVLIRNFSDKAGENVMNIKNELEKLPFIANVGAAQHRMGGGCSGQSIALLHSSEEKPINEYRVTPGFCETMQIKLKDGSFFDETQYDKRTIILNEAAARMLGLQFYPGVQVSYKGEPAEVRGIVKDFYFNGYAGKAIEPLVLCCNPDYGWYIYLRTRDKFTQSNQQQVTQVIKKFDPEYVMTFMPVSDTYAAKFEKDEQVFNMVSSGAYLAIVLSFVGLLALSIMNVARRTKEIGIRKVVGSSEAGIMGKLLGETMILVAIASVFAFGVSYLLMARWLSNYALKIHLGIGYFLLSGFFALLIAFLAISWQSWRAATRNPVEALRYE